MNKKITGTLKSCEEIESSINIIDRDGDYSYFRTDRGVESVSNHIWDLCGKEIDAVNIGRFNTGFDIMYVHQIEVDGCKFCPIIYLKREWING